MDKSRQQMFEILEDIAAYEVNSKQKSKIQRKQRKSKETSASFGFWKPRR